MRSIERLSIGCTPRPKPVNLLLVTKFDLKGFQHAFSSFLRRLLQSIFGIDRAVFRRGRNPALSRLVNLLVSSAPLFDPGRGRFKNRVAHVEFIWSVLRLLGRRRDVAFELQKDYKRLFLGLAASN